MHGVVLPLPRCRAVFLERDERAVVVVREVDERKAARRDQVQDAVVLDLAAGGQRLVPLHAANLAGARATIDRP